MKKFLGAAVLAALIGTDAWALAQVTFGVQIGRPPATRVVEVRPVRPGVEYIWVDGYWYPKPNRRGYQWRQGYWALPPYIGAVWIAPRYQNNRYYHGYWFRHDRDDHDHDHDRNGHNVHDNHHH